MVFIIFFWNFQTKHSKEKQNCLSYVCSFPEVQQDYLSFNPELWMKYIFKARLIFKLKNNKNLINK